MDSVAEDGTTVGSATDIGSADEADGSGPEADGDDSTAAGDSSLDSTGAVTSVADAGVVDSDDSDTGSVGFEAS